MYDRAAAYRRAMTADVCAAALMYCPADDTAGVREKTNKRKNRRIPFAFARIYAIMWRNILFKLFAAGQSELLNALEE